MLELVFVFDCKVDALVELAIWFVFEFVFDCKADVLLELVPGVDALELGDVLDEDVFDEFVLPDASDAPLEDPCDTGKVELVVSDTTVEFPESVEKAYCGKTSIAARETMNRIFRSILIYLPDSQNKELLHIVQEQCY